MKAKSLNRKTQGPKSLPWQKVIFIGLGILLLALFLRTYNIFSIPIFADEAIYIRWSQVMRALPQHRFLPLSDGKQPLFMWVTIPFLKIINDPLVAARTLSALTGIGTAVGIFLISLKLFKNKSLGLFSSLLYVVSPFGVFFDRMALVDSMLSMFGVWTFYFATLTTQTLRLDYAMLTGFTLGFAYLTKSPGLFFYLLLPSTAILLNFKKENLLKLNLLKLLALYGVSWVIGYGMYNILRLGPEFHMLSSRNADYLFPISEVIKHPLDPLIPHLKDIANWFWILLPGTVLVLLLIAFKRLTRYPKEMLLLTAWVTGPLLVEAAIAKVFTARYVLFTIPYLFVLAGLSWLVLKRFRKWLMAFSVVPALAINFLFLNQPEKAPLPKGERSGYLEEWTAGTGIREVAKFIKEEKTRSPERNIIVGTEGFFGTLPDGLQIYIADIPGVVVKGVGITITEIDSSLINAKKAGDKVYLVVNSTRFKIEDPSGKGLVLVQSFPKAVRSDGTQESLLLWEVTQESITPVKK